MKYTIYSVSSPLSKNKFISAYRGTKDISKVSIQNKKILKEVGNNFYKETLLIAENITETNLFLKKYKEKENTIVVRIDKRILVKDKDGNIYKVYKDDKRINKTLFSINKGKVCCKDKDGNILYINKEEFEKGPYVGIMKNKVTVKDKDGNTLSINKKNKDYKDGNFYFHLNDFSNKGKKYKKYKQNNENSIRQKKFIEKNKILYPFFKKDIKFKDGHLFVNDFCKHGNLIINKKNLQKFINITEFIVINAKKNI